MAERPSKKVVHGPSRSVVRTSGVEAGAGLGKEEPVEQRYLVLVMSNPVDGREHEYNQWYEDPHLDQVIETAGFASAQRFVLGAAAGVESPHRYLALYETVGESAEEVLERLDESRPRRLQSDAIDAAGAGVWVFEPMGELHTATDHGMQR